MINRIVHFFNYRVIKRFILHCEINFFRESLGFCDKTADVRLPAVCTCPRKLFFYENTNVYSGSSFIINPEGDGGKFIMKRGSGAAQGLTVITGTHKRELGSFYKNLSNCSINNTDKDIIVEEDVWIGANVTLLSGVIIGRGSTIGSGAIVRDNVPPYSIVLGNPAKITGFCFTPDEVLSHERSLYPEGERLSIELLEKNYSKYFLKRLKEIKDYIKM